MRENKGIALVASLFVLLGIPLIFLIVSLYTGEWRFLVFSIAPALAAGLTGLIITTRRIREDKTIS
jgi:hypothetical protein